MYGYGPAFLTFGPRLWAGAAILGLAWFWPLGLGLLALFAWSRKMGCWRYAHHGHHHDHGRRREEFAERFREAFRFSRPSGNSAFDEYRSETLRRLEEDQQEFQSFLDRLRHAKDKAQFDQFMTERMKRPEGPAPEPEPPRE
ncbi:MAG TPA: DUF2852 domain-containing protein [Aliidongia sp.]|nr:DUF2852 domain-containing protein [Aliidongia sp.]